MLVPFSIASLLITTLNISYVIYILKKLKLNLGINLGYCGNVISSSLNALFSYFPPGTLPVLAGTSALPPGHICPSPRAHLPVPPNCLLDSELTPPIIFLFPSPPLIEPLLPFREYSDHTTTGTD